MGLSLVKTYSGELRQIIVNLIAQQKGHEEVKEIVSHISLYALSHGLDMKSYLFDEQYAYLGSYSQKIKEVINAVFDYVFYITDHRDFAGFDSDEIEDSLKEEVYSFITSKITENNLVKDNYTDFIKYLRKTYDPRIVFDLIRTRIIDNHEKREEFKALLEYMIFTGRNYIEEEEFERVQSAINFRLNMLKNYNASYFCKNFFLLKHQTRIYPEEYHSQRYFFPDQITKDLKNIILRMDRGESYSLSVQEEAKDIIQRQLRLVSQNQKRLSQLKKD